LNVSEGTRCSPLRSNALRPKPDYLVSSFCAYTVPTNIPVDPTTPCDQVAGLRPGNFVDLEWLEIRFTDNTAPALPPPTGAANRHRDTNPKDPTRAATASRVLQQCQRLRKLDEAGRLALEKAYPKPQLMMMPEGKSPFATPPKTPPRSVTPPPNTSKRAGLRAGAMGAKVGATASVAAGVAAFDCVTEGSVVPGCAASRLSSSEV